MSRQTSRLHGRASDLALIAACAGSARSGEPRIVVVEGEPGVGKTRLVREALTQLARPDDLVIAAHGVALTGEQFSFGVVTQVVRAVVRQLDDAELEQLPAQAQSLARAFTASGHGTPLDQMSRLQVFDGVAALVDALSQERMVWLIVDDVQWVDESSLDVLGYLARVVDPGQFLTTCTLRRGDGRLPTALNGFIVELRRLAHAESIPLGRLDRDMTRAQIADLIGGPPTAKLVDRILALSAGNPFLTEELLRGGVTERSSLPPTVRDLMLDRVRRLQPDGVAVVESCALAQRRIDHDVLARVVGFDADRLDRALEEVIAHHVLERVPTSNEYFFHHALMKEAVQASLPTGAARRLHRAWAEAIESMTMGVQDLGAKIEAAFHWSWSDDVERGLVASLDAARRESTFLRPSERAPLLSQSLRLWDHVAQPETISGRRRDELVLSAIGTWQIAGDWERALELIEAELARAGEDDPVRRLTLELFRAGALAQVDRATGVPDDFREEEAAALMLAARDGQWLADGCIAVARHVADLDVAIALFERAIAAADSSGVAVAHHQAAQDLADIEVGRGDMAAALAILDELTLFIAEHLPDALSDVEAQLSGFLLRTGETTRALEMAEQAARRLPPPELSPRLFAYVAQNQVEALIELGRWNEASELLTLARSLYPRGWTGFELDTQAVRFAVYRGDLDEAATLMEAVWTKADTSERHEFDYLSRRGRARVCELGAAAFRGDVDEVRRAATPLWALPSVEEQSSLLWRPLMDAARAEADHKLRLSPGGRSRSTEEAGEQHVALLQRTADALFRFGVLGDAWSAHVNAELRLWHGDADAASWEDVVAAWAKTGHVHDRAWALVRLAECQIRTGKRDDALRTATEVAAVADQLGADPLRQAVTQLAGRGRLPMAREEVPRLRAAATKSSGLNSLTDREVEVLQLLAEGASNVQIAGRLFISPKTASVHVSRILTKLDVRSRGEAGAIAFRQGLMTGEPTP